MSYVFVAYFSANREVEIVYGKMWLTFLISVSVVLKKIYVCPSSVTRVSRTSY